MNSPNKNKVKWVILLGAPKLDDPKWKDRTPTQTENTPVWMGQTIGFDHAISGKPHLYSSKDEATKEMERLDKIGDPYYMRVEKYVSRKAHP